MRTLERIPQIDAALDLAAEVSGRFDADPPDRRETSDMTRWIERMRTAATLLVGSDNRKADIAISAAAALRLAIDFIHFAKLSNEHPDPAWRAYFDERATGCERGSDEAIAHARGLMAGRNR